MLKRIFPQIERATRMSEFKFRIFDNSFDYGQSMEVAVIRRIPTTVFMKGLIRVK